MKKAVVAFLAATFALAGAAYLLLPHLLDSEPGGQSPADAPAAPPPLAPLQAVDNVEVISVQGRVERRGPNEVDWKKVAVGDNLGSDESIKTAKDANTRLRIDDKSEIDLKTESELTVKEINETVHRFNLVRGRIGVRYDESGTRMLRVESEHSEAVAEASAGVFQIQNAGGVVSVATTTGEVELSAGGRSVVVGGGRISRVLPGEAPSAPMDIPAAVVLRVAKPGRRVQRQRYTYVRGKTDVGARVSVNEIPAEVDRRGRFKVRVPLKEGRNRIQVVAEDVAGNIQRTNLPVIIVDANAPIRRMEFIWDQKGTPG